MFHRIKARFALLFVILLSLTLSGCGGASSTDSGAQDQEIIRVGWIPSVNFIAFLSTIDQWESPDTKVELVEFKSSSDTLVALNQGNIDLGTVGYSVLADGLAQADMPLEYIAGVSTKGAFFVARTEAGITDWSDLKGKRLGGVRGSPEYIHLNGSMEAHGLDLGKDAEFINFQTGSDIIVALQNGEIDGAVSYEPLVSQVVLNGAAVKVPKIQMDLFSNSFELSSGLLANRAFVEEHGDWTAEFLKEYSEAVDELSNNPQAAVETYLKYAPGDANVIKEAADNVTVTYKLNEEQIRAVGKTLLESGQLETDMSQELMEHVNYGPLSEGTGKSPQQLGKSD